MSDFATVCNMHISITTLAAALLSHRSLTDGPAVHLADIPQLTVVAVLDVIVSVWHTV